jgi:hypothetical protein
MDILQATSIEQGRNIHRCREYLQATTIADIATAEGNMITDLPLGSFKNPANFQRISKHKWPRQPRPGPKAWTAWRTALQRYLSKDKKTRYCRHTLGRWTVTPQQSRQPWNHYYDHTTGRKFQKNEGTWTSYLTKRRTRRTRHQTANRRSPTGSKAITPRTRKAEQATTQHTKQGRTGKGIQKQ